MLRGRVGLDADKDMMTGCFEQDPTTADQCQAGSNKAVGRTDWRLQSRAWTGSGQYPVMTASVENISNQFLFKSSHPIVKIPRCQDQISSFLL